MMKSIRGKRIWGPAALWLILLRMILKELGIKPPQEYEIDIYKEAELIEAAINGINFQSFLIASLPRYRTYIPKCI